MIRPLGFATVLLTPFIVTFRVALVKPGSTTIVSFAELPVINNAVPPSPQVSVTVRMLPAAAGLTTIVTTAV